MNISMIGTGYVGLTTGTCLSELGMNVLCMDTDEKKVNMLKEGNIPIYEPDLEEMVRINSSNNKLLFTSNIKKAVDFSEVIFIAVGTPPLEDNSADLNYIYTAVKEIAIHMNSYKLIVVKSTVPVGTGKKIKNEIKNILSKEGKEIEFDLVSNPEFLRQGSAVLDFMKPNRVVIGIENQRSKDIMNKIYDFHFSQGIPILYTNIETAEMIKYVSNAFLATKISFINEIANMCEKCNVDISMVSKAMGLDERIGPKFLNPGPGYGGSCFPKDTKALMHIGKTIGYQPKIVKAVISVNNSQNKLMIKKIETAVGKIGGKTFSVLGVSFKPDTDDIRESPALPIIQYFLKKKAKVKIYDPKAMENCKKIFKKAEYCTDVYTACLESDCVIVVTEWDEFRNIDFLRLKSIMNSSVLIDLRNIFEPDYVKGFGFLYEGVGRR